MRKGTNERTYTTTKHITTLLLRSRVKIVKIENGGTFVLTPGTSSVLDGGGEFLSRYHGIHFSMFQR